VNWNACLLIFAASFLAVALLDRIARGFRPKTQPHTFPCFYCKQRTTRRDGYCCDEHRDKDLRTAGFQADPGGSAHSLD